MNDNSKKLGIAAFGTLAVMVVVSAASAGIGWFNKRCESCQRKAPAAEQPVTKHVFAQMSVPPVSVAVVEPAEAPAAPDPGPVLRIPTDTLSAVGATPAMLNVRKTPQEMAQSIRNQAAQYRPKAYYQSPYNGRGCTCAPPAPRRGLFGRR